MSLMKILLLILLTNSTLYCWGLNNMEFTRVDTFPSKELFKWKQISGNLKEVLIDIYDTSPQFIFSNEMSKLEDSILIDFEFQEELVHSAFFSEFLLSTLQRTYKFKIRDTLLAKTETVYVVSVKDKSKLEKNEIDDHDFFIIANDSNNQYDVGFCFGMYLKESKFILELIKLIDDQVRKKIPVIAEFQEEYDGLYNFAIPMHAYNKDGSAKYFESLLQVNTVLNNYGLQVQKVTRPITGKVIEFFELKSDFKVPYRPVLKF